MWFVARLIDAHSNVSEFALASYRFRRRLRSVIDTVQTWRQRAHERESLRRYLRYELKGAAHDLGKDAWGESSKRFWEV